MAKTKRHRLTPEEHEKRIQVAVEPVLPTVVGKADVPLGIIIGGCLW